jgi:hypothetical protein
MIKIAYATRSAISARSAALTIMPLTAADGATGRATSGRPQHGAQPAGAPSARVA